MVPRNLRPLSKDRGRFCWTNRVAENGLLAVLGVGIAAFRRSKVFGLYCARIHKPKDTVCEENNMILIRDTLIRIIEKGN